MSGTWSDRSWSSPNLLDELRKWIESRSPGEQEARRVAAWCVNQLLRDPYRAGAVPAHGFPASVLQVVCPEILDNGERVIVMARIVGDQLVVQVFDQILDPYLDHDSFDGEGDFVDPDDRD